VTHHRKPEAQRTRDDGGKKHATNVALSLEEEGYLDRIARARRLSSRAGTLRALVIEEAERRGIKKREGL
jgi:hypothetical protein